MILNERNLHFEGTIPYNQSESAYSKQNLQCRAFKTAKLVYKYNNYMVYGRIKYS